MTLNASGKISLAGTTVGQSIQVELGGTGTTRISLNDNNVRTLAGVPSGRIVMPTNFYGKTYRPALSFTFSASTANASLNVTSISGYVAGASDITITVNSGVYLYATSTGSSGLTLSGGTTGDTITLVNNGFIMGQGGAGGNSPSGNVGNPGGTALSLGFNTTVNNTNASAYIGGGGGGGGGGIFVSGGNPTRSTSGGGGAGGGNGGGGGGLTPSTGGGIGSSGAGGNTAAPISWGGGAGGRIFPASTAVATTTIGGAVGIGVQGGGSGASWRDPLFGGSTKGGDGGGTNQPGGTTANMSFTIAAGGGGGWGASGGSSSAGRAPGSGGKAVNLNTFSVTWVSGDTTRVYGVVS